MRPRQSQALPGRARPSPEAPGDHRLWTTPGLTCFWVLSHCRELETWPPSAERHPSALQGAGCLETDRLGKGQFPRGHGHCGHAEAGAQVRRAKCDVWNPLPLPLLLNYQHGSCRVEMQLKKPL